MPRFPTQLEQEVHTAVCDRNERIADIAKRQCVSSSTIRRMLDHVTEFDCQKFTLQLDGDDVRKIVGWLRNGNTSAGVLAEHIVSICERGDGND